MMLKIKNNRIVYLISLISIIAIILNINYIYFCSATFLNRSDPIESSLEYDIEANDLFVYNCTQTDDKHISISFMDLNIYRNGTANYLNLKRIINNTQFTDNSFDYCNITYEDYTSLFKQSYKDNIIIDMDLYDDFRITTNIGNLSVVANLFFSEYFYIKMTSGNATDMIIAISTTEMESIGNDLIIYLSHDYFYGLTWHGIQIGDTFDVYPLTIQNFTETDHIAELHSFFNYETTETQIVNETLESIFSREIAFLPIDVNITDIFQDGDGIFKTMMYSFLKSEDIMFHEFLGEEWFVEEYYNETFVEIYSEKEGLYNFTYYENGFNESAEIEGVTDPQNLQYNMTLTLVINDTLTERNVVNQSQMGIIFTETVTNRTNSEELIKVDWKIEVDQNLIYTEMHENPEEPPIEPPPEEPATDAWIYVGIGGGVAVAGVIGYFIYRSKKKVVPKVANMHCKKGERWNGKKCIPI